MKFFESRVGPSIFETYYRHAAKALETVEHMERCVAVACEDGDASEAIGATSKTELEADDLKNELREVMRGSVRLAISKEIFLDMISQQDRIADYAENVAEIISFRPLFEDTKARKLLMTQAQAVQTTVNEYAKAVEKLQELMESGFATKVKEELHQLIASVNLLEHKADEKEAATAAYVFSHGDEAPLAAAHMYRVAQRLDDVANATERAANSLLPLASH
ncbi:MAG: DUF47 family protein [Candidatus Thermoplasmatota archaeon]|nr:DUF47 family protein [Candidatus Thermoplasmatota archaeon]